MKKLEVPLLTSIKRTSPMEQVSATLNELVKHPIAIAPWPEFNYTPKVEFSIAHGHDCIFIRYFVEETIVKATYYNPDDPVYKDSCVEFFIAFDDEEEYYNLEFNLIGTCKLNFGMARNNRIVVEEDLVRKIRHYTTIENISDANAGMHWALSLMIPVEVFSEHKIKSLSEKKCSANFYKCGDDLPVPHYLCWNNIVSAKPDFHLQQYFGKILFS